MNSLKNTTSKVQELEKRLDNSLLQSGLNVGEVKMVAENEILAEGENRYLITAITGKKSPQNIVLQGEVKFACENLAQGVEINIALVLDGYKVYSEKRTVTSSEYSWNILEALAIAGGVTQNLEMVIVVNGMATLEEYKFFLWGYGEGLGISESSVEPRLSATSKDGRVVAFIVAGNLCYSYYSWGLEENLSLDNFTYFGKLKQIVPVQISLSADVTSTTETEKPLLYNFFIDEENHLKYFSGEATTLSSVAPVEVCGNITAVSACEIKNSNILIVMADGKHLKMTTFDGEGCGTITEIRDFSENIIEVSLVGGCDSTQFLVVGLSDGRNYLLSSTTEISSSDKHSNIKFCSSIEFL